MTRNLRPDVRAARTAAALLAAAALTASSGCLHMRGRPAGPAQGGGLCRDIPAVPVSSIPPEYLGRPKSDLIEISFTRLRQTPTDVYRLADGDVLGVYIENVLAGGEDEAPPVNFPEDPSQPPSIGFPIPVREDGTMALPLVDPVDVDGMTVTEATEAIRQAYTVDKEILVEGEDRIIVTLLRRRVKRVLVIREEGGDVQNNRSANRDRRGSTDVKHGAGYNVDLPAYENDLLHALNETGGLPGLDAENEILIFKGGRMAGYNHDETVARLLRDVGPCECRPDIPDDPNVVRIPVRFYPDEVPTFTEEDIILEDGDIVYVQGRNDEVFYTGGLVEGGEHPLPRDYDINVLQAIAIAGGDVGSNAGIAQLGAQRGGRGGGVIAPGRAIVLRQIPCVGEVPIEVDLKAALSDPSQRLLIQPGDTILVRYTKCEATSNALLNLLQFNVLIGGLN